MPDNSNNDVRKDPRVSMSEEIHKRDQALTAMIDLWQSGARPEGWPEPLIQIFAQACVPFVRLRGNYLPTPGLEHAKGLLLTGLFWPGHTTFERVPDWIIARTGPGRRDPSLETLAEHTRQHLRVSIRRRQGWT